MSNSVALFHTQDESNDSGNKDMRKKLVFGVCAVHFLLSALPAYAVSTTSFPATAEKWVVIRNESPFPIIQVFVREDGGIQWSENLIQNVVNTKDTTRVKVAVRGCMVSFKAQAGVNIQYDDGSEEPLIYDVTSFNICSTNNELVISLTNQKPEANK